MNDEEFAETYVLCCACSIPRRSLSQDANHETVDIIQRTCKLDLKQERITIHRGGTFLCFGNGWFDLLDLYALTLSDYYDYFGLL